VFQGNGKMKIKYIAAALVFLALVLYQNTVYASG
jgi:hypothetical protein